MKNLQAACLAIVIERPELASILFSNTTDETWTVHDFKALFQTMSDMYENREEWSWPLLADKHACVMGLAKTLVSLPQSMCRGTLIDYLSRIKRAIAKRELLKVISAEASKPEPDFEELGEIIQRAGMQATEQEDPSPTVAFNLYLERLRRGHSGYRTGFPTLDHLTDALNPGELVTFMGRTTTGKTFFALNTMLHIVTQNPTTPVAFFSLEMPRDSIAERLSQMEFQRGRYDLKTEVLQDAAGFLSLFADRFRPVTIFGRVYSVPEISLLIKTHGSKVAFIDFLGLVRSEDTSGSLYQQTTKKITELKQMAKDRDCLVVLMVQLSRAGGDGSIPVSIDMARESGAIEEMSDFLYGIYNPSIAEDADPKWQGRLCIKLLKNKRGATQGIVCRFDKLTGLITEEMEEA